MPRDWAADRTTDSSDPFSLRREVLNPIGTDIAAGGLATASITFSQTTGAIGVSGVWTNRLTPRTITFISLSAITAPAGGNYVVTFKRNGTVFATLTMPAGSVADVTSTVSVALATGDKVSVETTSVGATPPTGCVAKLETVAG
jgi:hypothetical protein